MKTERLEFRPLSREDLELFLSINTNPHVREYLWDDQIISRQLAENLLREIEEQFSKNKWGLWKLMENADHSCAGYAGLWTFFNEEQPQLLYVLLPEYIGQGYATEAARKVIEYAFNELEFRHLVAAVDKSNAQSRKVCERLSMALEEERDIEGKPTLFYKIDKST